MTTRHAPAPGAATLPAHRPPRFSTTVVSTAAALWSALYTAAAIAWSLGAPGFPFGAKGDRGAEGSILAGVSAHDGAPVIATLAAGATVLAGALARQSVRGRPLSQSSRLTVLTAGTLLAVTLTVVLPDPRILMALGYAPVFLLAQPFGFADGVSYLEAWSWPVINQSICVIGGILWAAVAARQITDRRVLLDTARRWTGTAVAVAVTIPLLYAAERISWAAGIPLGADQALLDDLGTEGRIAALGLGLGAVGGAVLTLGLVQRWGSVFPRWIPFLRGRRVPPALAVVPAALVSVAVTAAGVSVVRISLTGLIDPGALSMVWPMLLWPLWGLALGVATVGYHQRRRDETAPAEAVRPHIAI